MNKVYIRDDLYTSKLGKGLNYRYKQDMHVYAPINYYIEFFNYICWGDVNEANLS